MNKAVLIERIAAELAEDNLAEGVRYLEVRFAPQLHMREGSGFREVVEAAARGLEAVKQRHNGSATVTSGGDLPFEFGAQRDDITPIALCNDRFLKFIR